MEPSPNGLKLLIGFTRVLEDAIKRGEVAFDDFLPAIGVLVTAAVHHSNNLDKAHLVAEHLSELIIKGCEFAKRYEAVKAHGPGRSPESVRLEGPTASLDGFIKGGDL